LAVSSYAVSGQGYRLQDGPRAPHGLNPERILGAASALGGAETALARATHYAK
jgi:alkylation response protein AidB-like acyl-CoA dehydrogenase